MALSWQNLGWNGIPLSQLFATVPAAYRDLSMPLPSLHSLANDIGDRFRVEAFMVGILARRVLPERIPHTYHKS
jgi:hypothetical protein